MNRTLSQGMPFSYGVLYIFSYPLFSFAIHCLLARFSYRTPGRPVPPVRVRPTDRPEPPAWVPQFLEPMLCHAVLFYAVQHHEFPDRWGTHATLCHAMLCHAVLCCVLSHHEFPNLWGTFAVSMMMMITMTMTMMMMMMMVMMMMLMTI